VEKSAANGASLVTALNELGFQISPETASDIQRGKDFVQLKDGPFDLDLVFAPDGIERFSDAWARRVELKAFPCAILMTSSRARKQRTARRDMESLRVLRAFRDYWAARHPGHPPR
jgi:hypothetical protein